MRHIKKYESFFDPEQALVSIGLEFSESRIDKMLTEERSEWSDNYGELGNGEAEDQVIEQIISWYERTQKTKLDENQETKLIEALKRHFNLFK